MQTPTNVAAGWAVLRGRIVPRPISDLYVLHCWLINHRVTVAVDEWAADLASIASALGFPPGQSSRDVVARFIYTDSLVETRGLAAAS